MPSDYCDLRKAWREWNALPASERAPGAIRVGERGPIDTTKIAPSPPPGGLILKLYYRTLTSVDGKQLRHAEKKDFVHNYWMEGDVRDPQVIARVDLGIANPSTYVAQPDFLWLTEAEWKSLLPEHPTKGASFPVASAITERIFRYHLVPTMAFAEALPWPKKDVRGGELTLIVEEATPDRVRMRVEGFAVLGPDYETAVAEVRAKRIALGYEPRLLGYLEYHPTQRIITRFDMVALGDTFGTLGGPLHFFYRPGRQPLGVAFQLVDPDVPANRVMPRTGTSGSRTPAYFTTGK